MKVVASSLFGLVELQPSLMHDWQPAELSISKCCWTRNVPQAKSAAFPQCAGICLAGYAAFRSPRKAWFGTSWAWNNPTHIVCEDVRQIWIEIITMVILRKLPRMTQSAQRWNFLARCPVYTSPRGRAVDDFSKGEIVLVRLGQTVTVPWQYESSTFVSDQIYAADSLAPAYL